MMRVLRAAVVLALARAFVPPASLSPRLTLAHLETDESAADVEEPAPRAAGGRVGGRAVGDSVTERSLESAQKLTRNTERATFRLLARAPLAALGGSLAVIALLAAGVSALLFDGGEQSYYYFCLLYTSPSPRDGLLSRMPSSA